MCPLYKIEKAHGHVLKIKMQCDSQPKSINGTLQVNRSLKRFPPGIAEVDRPHLQVTNFLIGWFFSSDFLLVNTVV